MDTYQKKPALGEQNSKIIEKSQKYKGDEWCLWVSIKARAYVYTKNQWWTSAKSINLSGP